MRQPAQCFLKLLSLLFVRCFRPRLVGWYGMNLFVKRNDVILSYMFLNSTVSGVPDNCQQPGSRINTAESGEIFQRASVGFLHYIMRILVAFNYPACKIIGRIQMMEKKLFETRQLLSHSNE